MGQASASATLATTLSLTLTSSLSPKAASLPYLTDQVIAACEAFNA
jgi:hypothetical protein